MRINYSTKAILTLITSFVLLQHSSLMGQSTYETKEDIYYYDDTAEGDDYQKERCKLDIYYPSEMDSFATIIWFHGGGLRAGHKFIPDILKEKGVAVVAVNYRLFPKVGNPVYTQDAAASVAWVFNNIEQYGGMRSRIFLSGHSAGGYLVSMVGLDKSYLQQHNIDADDIAGLIPFSGHAITHFTIREERRIDGKTVVVDSAAPIAHIRPDAPPYTIITGDRELELLGRYEENAYMWRMMQVIGHPDCAIYELDGFNHGEMYLPALGILLKEVRRILGRD